MELGMFTSGYQRYPLERAFSDANRFGYDYIELWGGRPHAFAPDLNSGELRAVLALIDHYSMPVRVYTPEHNAYPYNFMSGSELQWRDSIDYLKLSLTMGKALGADYTLISTGHGGYTATRKEIWDRLKRSLRELTEHAESIGHPILLEALSPCETNVCTSAADLLEALDAVDSPFLLGMCDVVPPFVSREPILNYLDMLGSRMAHLHLVDSDGTDDTHLLPGDGSIPLAELLNELSEQGYSGRATLELVTAYLNEPSLYASRALRRVRNMLSEGQERKPDHGTRI